MNENLTKLLSDVDALLEKAQITTPISTEIEENVPEVVRKLRAARLARRLKRVEASKSRAGDNHYKRKRLKRRIEYHKYDRTWRKNYYKRSFKTHEGRYKRVQSLWTRRIPAECLDKCMDLDDYSALMSYVPRKLRQLVATARISGRGHNVHVIPAEIRYANSYENEDWKPVEDCLHSITRIRSSGWYTLDNVIVMDVVSGLVLFDSDLDSL